MAAEQPIVIKNSRTGCGYFGQNSKSHVARHKKETKSPTHIYPLTKSLPRKQATAAATATIDEARNAMPKINFIAD